MDIEDVITIENVQIYNATSLNEHATLKIAKAGVALNPPSGKVLIQKEDISHIELFKSTCKYNLRIFKEDKSVFNIQSVPFEEVEKVRTALTTRFDVPVHMLGLEVGDAHGSHLELQNRSIALKKGERRIFDIPFAEIENIVDVKSEAVVSLLKRTEGVTEVKLGCTENFITGLREVAGLGESPDILTIEEVQAVYPRGKNDLVFYDDAIKFLGKTYEHKVAYSNVRTIYKLKAQDGKNQVLYHLVLCLFEPIVQGNTNYQHVVVQVEDSEEVISVRLKLSEKAALKFPKLREEYVAPNHEVLTEILETLTNTQAVKSVPFTSSGDHKIKCSSRALEGYLFPLETVLIFAPKIVEISLNRILNVRFFRVDLSVKTAKSFDMKVILSDGEYLFDAIAKEEFGRIEKYFGDNGVSMDSEVIVEDVSSDASDDIESDIPDSSD